MSEPWSPYTKRIIIIIGLVLCALVLWRFREVIQPLIVALLVAYVLSPLVDFFAHRLGTSRTLATVMVYLFLIAVLIIALAIVIPVVTAQVRAIDVDLRQFYATAQTWLDYTVTLGEWSFNVQDIAQSIGQELSQAVTPLASGTLSLVVKLASGLLQGFFILIISFYMVKDAPTITNFFSNLPPLTTRGDFRLLRQEIALVWSAFFRGQLILCLVIGLIVTVTTTIVGLPNALAMGLIAGVLEFIPNFGPVVATVPAVLVALLNGSSWLPLSPVGFAVLIIVLYIIIQQVENNFLVPRILGGELDLHPLAVLIVVVAGASLAGILGVFLAAPVLATLRVVGRYAYRKLQDQDPFPPKPPKPPEPSIWQRMGQWFARRRLASSQPSRVVEPHSSDEKKLS